MRDDFLKQLRPKIKLPPQSNFISNIEDFQNSTLRPIIKFQNDTIVSYFENFASQFDKNWNSLDSEKKAKQIEHFFNKNQTLKTTIIGIIIGLFSQKELDIYLSNKSNLNKRILAITKERILSHL